METGQPGNLENSVCCDTFQKGQCVEIGFESKQVRWLAWGVQRPGGKRER